MQWCLHCEFTERCK